MKWYPQDLIGRAKVFDMTAANQNQGSKCIFNAGISHLAHQKACFTPGEGGGRVLDVSLVGEVRRGPSYPDPV